MAPATTSPAESRRLVGSRRRTEAPRRMLSPPPKKLRPMAEILAKARYAVVERDDYSNVSCEQCGSGEQPDELLLCDKCDRGFHMKCVRPIVVRVPIGSWLCPNCSGQRRVRSFSQKKIIDFFKIQKCNAVEEKCASSQVFSRTQVASMAEEVAFSRPKEKATAEELAASSLQLKPLG